MQITTVFPTSGKRFKLFYLKFNVCLKALLMRRPIIHFAVQSIRARCMLMGRNAILGAFHTILRLAS
jgi:hypothetical protein